MASLLFGIRMQVVRVLLVGFGLLIVAGPVLLQGQDLTRHGQIASVSESQVRVELNTGWVVEPGISGEIFEPRENRTASIAQIVVREVNGTTAVCDVTGRSGTLWVDAGDFVNFTGAMRRTQTVSVESEPASIVYLDGRRIGRTPQSLEVEPGTYTIRLSRQGYEPFEREVDVGYGTPPAIAAQLDPYEGRLLLRTEPDSATVFINGRRIPQATPLQRRLPPGTYRIEARKPGYKASEETVRIRDRDRQVRLRLPRAKGRLVVESSPNNARIFVDNQERGTTPDTLQLEPGSYQVQVRQLGYEAFQQTVDVPDSSVTLMAELRRAGERFAVQTDPSGATIFVNGDRMATTPDTLRLIPGVYDVRLERDGYQTWEETVEVEQNPEPLEVTLDEAPGILVISSEPSGASVTVDEEEIGTTTAVLERLPPGAYEVEIAMPGYQPVRRTISVSGQVGQAKTVNVELEPNVAQGRSLEYYMRRGRALREAGNLDEAIEYFSQALRVSPEYEFAQQEIERTQFQREKEGWRLAARQYIEEDNFEEAQRYVDDILDVYPADVQAQEWNRVIENRLAVYADRPKISLRRESFAFQTIPLLGDVLDENVVDSPDSLRFARDVSGVAFQYWGKSDQNGLFGVKLGFYNPNYAPLPPGDELSAFPYKSLFDFDMKLGWYPVQNEWGNIGLFFGPGVMAVNPSAGSWQFVPTAPLGFSIQVFPLRRVVLPTSVPNFPVSRIGIAFTTMYKWALPIEMKIAEGQREEVSFSRAETGVSIIFRL